ncbi:MAG: hypothetical protein OSJ43_15330 [Oscillospiraceae bacterium]|nr:hypothetical protein [Oscillospiraceae bacterium]
MPDRKDKWKGKTFKVTIKLPEHVSESIQREKINRLYDILKPKKSDDYDTENDDKFSENPT